ncbi:MAG: diguanylate cyclase domain-containing protein, partial [Spirochaetota bacterium]
MDSQRILIVEDERIIALDLQRRLEKFGFNVVGIAATADESVELAGEYRPNLILMDIMLAGPVDGIEAATRIKQTLSIPVVFLTAYADDTTIERAKDAEPFGYVLKPFKERELYTTIDMALYKSRLHAELLRQKRWFSSVLHSVADGLVATDQDFQVQLLNPVAETLTGFRSETAQGLPLSQVFQLYDDNTELKVSLPAGFEAETPRYFDHVYLKNKQGAEIHVEGVISAIHGETGDVEGIAIAFRDVSDIKSMSDKIVYQASHDALTGLINRQELFARIGDLIDNSRSNGHHHAFAYVDLDQFKVVNEVCGHGAGDELLRQVAQTIDETVTGNYILGRLGGDEFGLVF